MRRLKLLAAISLAGAAVACAPNPIVARDPVPAPSPELGYACDSRPTLLNAFHTNCDPVSREQRAVVRAKG
ncbi:MAG TPA: hypothetical protein VF641_10555 [Methylobacterium sp.]